MSKAIEMDEVFTPEEVAQSLKVAGGTIRNLIRKKELFAYQVGSQYRIPRFAIEQWLAPKKGLTDRFQRRDPGVFKLGTHPSRSEATMFFLPT